MDIAARKADKLVDNSVVHGEPFNDDTIALRLIIDATTRELLIEVDDAFPSCPGFAEATNQSRALQDRPHGLWWVAHYRGQLSWDVTRDDGGRARGKKVQVILPVH